MTFCSCGEFSYTRYYVLRHQRTTKCYLGHLFEVDASMFGEFFQLIYPLVQDNGKLLQLVKGFPSSRAVTAGPCPRLMAKLPPPTLLSPARDHRHPGSSSDASTQLRMPDPLLLHEPQPGPRIRKRGTPPLHQPLALLAPCTTWSNASISLKAS